MAKKQKKVYVALFSPDSGQPFNVCYAGDNLITALNYIAHKQSERLKECREAGIAYFRSSDQIELWVDGEFNDRFPSSYFYNHDCN